ncbi:MAG: TIGR04348 family glycosyltransferase [Burkholderiaceae bacterium]|nr:TIGR04348 family glycosyltransferase [Burkholderiaceae bacterium]
MRPLITIVTPALSDANNGNWQTARRWASFLGPGYRVRLTRAWTGEPADAMIALHARRSAESIARYADTGRPIALVLTGTDLYRDIEIDASARRSLTLARELVVLQAAGVGHLPTSLQARTRVIYQSAPTLTRLPPRRRSYDLAMVGHLRAEKDPLTAVRALSRIHDSTLRLRIVGDARDETIGTAIARAAASDPRLQWLGGLPHAQARREIRRARLLLLPSLMEGGANVLIEAVTCGVAAICSRIDGSIGMLGPDYEGYFPVGDADALATLIERCRRDDAFVGHLEAQASARAALFEPARERRAVHALARALLEAPGPA